MKKYIDPSYKEFLHRELNVILESLEEGSVREAKVDLTNLINNVVNAATYN